MAFDNVTFPYYPMKHGISKTIIDPVSVVSNGNREYRLKRQAWERYEWTLPVQTMTDAQKEEIKGFLLERQHSLNSFKFVDPDMSTWNDFKLELHNPAVFTQWDLNLPYDKNLPDVAGSHPIFSGVNSGLTDFTLTRNGNPISARDAIIVDGVPVIEYLPGIITDVMRVTGTVSFTVRLASTLSYALEALNTNNETLGVNHAAIKLVEVFGEY